jgi:hemerythrin superfamily protein
VYETANMERRSAPHQNWKEVIFMNWKSSSPEQKTKWLKEQMEDIRRSRALLDRFEQVTEKWLNKLGNPQKAK